ncbi:S-layer homology domain-containing protein [Paenibacillus sp. D2_2]|uniref:S-layer homology domain-containing protein n=1 Tax=Paenibacillus sp. D2_2 TaxID=3073092 RepID=UPI0028168D2B|nr:S-layer homology domain-containing protein [Paenibacillus sp. D2_2]WMT40920.1 S-layer homology domain-containing protein [Paenibacillus sp. D2_2]
MTDVAGHWAKSSIEKALAKGIVTGYADGTFRPNQQVSRAEFVTMISRALSIKGTSKITPFTDQGQFPGWALEAINQSVGSGLISGYTDGTFRPNQQLTRLEMAVILVRAAGLPLDSAAKLAFNDADYIPSWAVPYVAAAYQAGLIQGVSGNRFAPGEKATRAEAVTVIMSIVK